MKLFSIILIITTVFFVGTNSAPQAGSATSPSRKDDNDGGISSAFTGAIKGAVRSVKHDAPRAMTSFNPVESLMKNLGPKKQTPTNVKITDVNHPVAGTTILDHFTAQMDPSGAPLTDDSTSIPGTPSDLFRSIKNAKDSIINAANEAQLTLNEAQRAHDAIELGNKIAGKVGLTPYKPTADGLWEDLKTVYEKGDAAPYGAQIRVGHGIILGKNAAEDMAKNLSSEKLSKQFEH